MILRPVFVDKDYSDIPDEGVICIGKVGPDGTEYVVFRCPCGCGQAMILPVNVPRGWQITVEGDTLNTSNVLVTLSPSILLMDGCRSHYFIRRNEVVYV